MKFNLLFLRVYNFRIFTYKRSKNDPLVSKNSLTIKCKHKMNISKNKQKENSYQSYVWVYKIQIFFKLSASLSTIHFKWL